MIMEIDHEYVQSLLTSNTKTLKCNQCFEGFVFILCIKFEINDNGIVFDYNDYGL